MVHNKILRVNTRPYACVYIHGYPYVRGYSATCTWTRGHVHVDSQPHTVYKAHNQILTWRHGPFTLIQDKLDTWRCTCGYKATCMCIYSHVHVDTQPHAFGYTATCMWIHGHRWTTTCTLILNQWTHVGADSYPIRVWYRAVAIVQNQNLSNGPQHWARSCPVVQSGLGDYAQWLMAQKRVLCCG